jgi:hypothetical protein
VPNVFATQLCASAGTLWLGGYDPTFATADPQYTPMPTSLLSKYYYVVELASVALSGTSIPIASSGYEDAVLDTGSSVSIVPSAAFSTISQTLSQDAHFQQIFGGSASAATSWFSNPDNCVSVSQTKQELDALLPSLTLVFGSNPSISIEASPTESYLVEYAGHFCPALYAQDPGPTFPFAADLGAPMLRSSVVIFDREKNRVGFAPHRPCP